MGMLNAAEVKTLTTVFTENMANGNNTVEQQGSVVEAKEYNQTNNQPTRSWIHNPRGRGQQWTIESGVNDKEGPGKACCSLSSF